MVNLLLLSNIDGQIATFKFIFPSMDNKDKCLEMMVRTLWALIGLFITYQVFTIDVL